MPDSLVLCETRNGVATLTLNHPQKRNALSSAMMSAIKERLEAIRDDPAARVVVFKAEGPVFSAGHDLGELRDGCAADHAGVFQLCADLMALIRELPQPVIAQVDGLATAAGCQLVAACDLAVCSEESRFATPGVKVGLFCTSPGVAVARAVMPKKALEMLLTGTPLTASEAERAGLVNRVVPRERLDAAVCALAEPILAASAETVAIGKRAFYQQIDMPCAQAYTFASEVMVDNLAKPDAKEGITAFFDKRQPQWSA